ncbi:trypsin-like serine protease [Candidatus Saccharibacteria bacterium]|nr:trypsin-like serine protease [Candidatus Saccharibacteria bacterium]
MELNLPVRIKKKHLLIFLVLIVGILIYLYRAPISSFLQERLTKLEIVTVQKIVTEEEAVISVVDTASPAVVSVVAEQTILTPFFGVQTDKQGIGTGFVIRENGIILTNRHVVSESDTKYFVVTGDGTEYEVKEIHLDTAYDLAILKIDASGLPTITLGDSDQLKVGQTVVAIGNALGRFSNTVTRGVVSGIGRGITAGSALGGQTEQLEDVIQTDAAINPGNSGGPLLNLSAQVVGINVAVAAEAENIGFAIPVNLATPVVEQFEQTGRIVRPFLGVRYTVISEDAAKVQNVPQGVLVQGVVDGSGAQRAGVEVGDVITSFGGVKIDEKNTLAKLIISYEVGEEVVLGVYRNGDAIELKAELGEAPSG